MIELKESGHLVKMITGDNILTAAHVALDLEMGAENAPALFIHGNKDGMIFKDIDDEVKFSIPFEKFKEGLFISLSQQNVLCISGICLDLIQQ